jgi:hypothetical protein
MTNFPLIPATGDEETDSADFDHVQEAKEQLAHVEQSARTPDIARAVAVAQVHALIAIAQALEALAFASEADDFGLGALRVDEVIVHNDYYREG